MKGSRRVTPSVSEGPGRLGGAVAERCAPPGPQAPRDARGDIGEVIASVLASGHRARFTATGDSMHPFIRSGQQLVVEAVDARALRRGDVVLARLERGLTAHRVVRIERCAGEVVSITTRGDNCELDDSPFSPAELVGRINSFRWGNLVTIIALARRWVRHAR
jgi:signal peptidase I